MFLSFQCQQFVRVTDTKKSNKYQKTDYNYVVIFRWVWLLLLHTTNTFCVSDKLPQIGDIYKTTICLVGKIEDKNYYYYAKHSKYTKYYI